MSLQSQKCHWYGGCGKSKGLPEFYAGVPGLCCECADQMAGIFKVPLDWVQYASFSIECGIRLEKQAQAKARLISAEHAAAGTLRLDSGTPGNADSLRRQGQKSYLGALIGLAKTDPHNRIKAQEIYRKYEAWIDKQYKV